MSIQPGKKFGLLTVVKEVSPDIYECTCKCGNLLDVWRSLLANKVQLDCSMCRRTTKAQLRVHGSVHGHVRRNNKKGLQWASSEFYSWANMIARCTRETHHAWADYGGRNIRVCERWRLPGGRGLKNFIDDMGPRPKGMTLDRKNPQGHYEPTNCQWADKNTQGQNRRNVLWPKGGPIKMPSVESALAMEARIQADFDERHPM